MKNFAVAALGCAALFLAGCNNNQGSLPYQQTSSPALANPLYGPIYINGAATNLTLSLGGSGQAQVVTITQNGAPSGTYFTATPGAGCAGNVAIVSNAQPSAPAAQPPTIASNGPFTVTTLTSNRSCAITLVSSADQTQGTLTIQ